MVEYLVSKKNITITLNKDFADNLIISGLCSPSIYETLINEIIKIPPDAIINIDIKNRKYEISYIDQKQNTIPFESKEGLKIIDKWMDKWGYIIRSIKNKTDSISMDLSGGFDTRAVLSVLYNSGINLNNIRVNSINEKFDTFKEDFKLATYISSIYGFSLNNKKLDNKGIKWDINNTLDCQLYTKLGFHKIFLYKTQFYKKPIFSFTGQWGETLRGYPNKPIKKYIEDISSEALKIIGYGKRFYDSSNRLLKRSINKLKSYKKYNSSYELSIDLYIRGRGINHFGKETVASFLANIYRLNPLADPELKKLKIDTNGKSYHDIIAYIYVRFINEIINVPIQGRRYVSDSSIKKAEKINNEFSIYKIKTDFNKNFYIDEKRRSPAPSCNNTQTPIDFLKKIIKEEKFIKTLNKLYNYNIYNWAKQFAKESNYLSFTHEIALLAIVKILKKILK